jgi:hypothetical protein
MLNWPRIFTLTVVTVFLMASGAHSADDWTFIAGKYAVSSDDCKSLASGQPLSKNLAKKLQTEVLTREGITSPRETHCRFRSAARESGTTKWTVKAACEELGQVSPDLENVKITKNPDGSLGVVAEDTFGPDPLTFKLCPK